MLIARRVLTADTGKAVQVWRIQDEHGHETRQYLESIAYGAGTPERALTAAGYTVTGPWEPEPGTDHPHERMPLTADARAYLLRMHRLYIPSGACQAADPAAAAIVRAILAGLLFAGHIPADTATLPSHYHQALRHEHATLSASPSPPVCRRAAERLERIIRTLETEYAQMF